MERQVKETVYSLFGITPVLEALDDEVVRPLNNFLNKVSDAPPPPKMIFISGSEGCGHRSVSSALVNELRRGKSNKRGDVHYKNREIKYLEWDFRESNSLHLIQIFKNAKKPQAVFTVLLMKNFEVVCPSGYNRPRRLRIDRNPPSDIIKQTLIKELEEIRAGRILVVAASSRGDLVDQEMLDKMDYKYHLSLPDEEARAKIIVRLLESENAELRPPTLMEKLIFATRHEYSTADLIYVVGGALKQARRRKALQEENGGGASPGGPLGGGVLKVMSVDFARYLDYVLEERLVQDDIGGGLGGEEEEEPGHLEDEQQVLDGLVDEVAAGGEEDEEENGVVLDVNDGLLDALNLRRNPRMVRFDLGRE